MKKNQKYLCLQIVLSLIPFIGMAIIFFMSAINVMKKCGKKNSVKFIFLTVLVIIFVLFVFMIIWFLLNQYIEEFIIVIGVISGYVLCVLLSVFIILIEKRFLNQ